MRINISQIFGFAAFLNLINQICSVELHTIVADQYVILNKNLTGFTFWSLAGLDIGMCARNCLRVKKCKSFNFRFSSGFCDMNDLTANSEEFFRNDNGIVYSEIETWPLQQLDPDCYERPCEEHEVCVPSFVGPFNNSPTCMNFMKSESTTQSSPKNSSAGSGSQTESTTQSTIVDSSECPFGTVRMDNISCGNSCDKINGTKICSQGRCCLIAE